MSAHRQIYTTGRFLNLFSYIVWFIAALMFVATIAGSFWGQVVFSSSVQVDPETPKELKPIQLKAETIGALRIDVEAVVPTNRWLTYEIQLKDQQGKLLASGLKQAWAEAGTWAEEGESGNWYEDDVMSGLDIRSKQAEPVTIALDILEYTDTSGKEIDQPVTFRVNIKNGAVDTRYLWAGLVGTAFLAFLTFFSNPSSGSLAIYKRIQDSDVAERGIVGGSKSLLRMYVDIAADESAPRQLNVLLTISNSNGEKIYSNSHLVNLRYSKNDKGRILSARGRLCKFFLIEPKDSYKFAVEVTPDASVDRTTLRVRANTRTSIPVEVIHLKAS